MSGSSEMAGISDFSHKPKTRPLVPFSVGFSFLCLLAIDILDSFFPILTNKVIGWHHQLSGHEFEQTPGEDWSAAVQGVAESRM